MEIRKKIYIISASFPFGEQETFLENEVVFLSKHFDVILVPTYFKKNDRIRKLPPNTTYFQPYISTNNLINVVKLLFNNKYIKSELLELYSLIKKGNFNPKLFREFIISVRALRLFSVSKAYKEIVNSKQKEIIYFYWGTSQILTINNMNQKTFVRIHGGEMNAEYYSGYIPFLSLKANTNTTFLPISNDAFNKIKDLNPLAKCKVNRLGTYNQFNYKQNEIGNVINIVSCSSIIPLKRIHLIIEALKLCGKRVNWKHFGDGLMQEILINKAENELGSNIKWSFMGRISNATLIDFYQNNNINLFINVSETEGVPVSIMEAMSFGIPCFAPNIGGISEIVNSQNGFLVDSNFDPKELATIIDNLSELNYLHKSKTARKTWEKLYNAETNYLKLKSDFL